MIKKATIISVKRIAQRTTEVAIKLPEDFNFTAGQYIWLMIPQLKYPDSKGNSRMFSIVSSPNKKRELDIVFRDSASGYKKTLVEMTPGAEINFSGPFGSLKLPEDISLMVVFMAGGVGVAPFLSMIRFSNETSSGHKITLVYANNSQEEAAYIDELSQMEQKNPKLKLVKLIGSLDTEILRQFTNNQSTFFVAGPKDYVDLVGNYLISHDVPFENMVFEQFYPGAAIKSEFEQKLDSPNPDSDAINRPYLLAMDNAINHIVITDTNGLVLYANKAAEIMTGYSFTEMKGNTPRLWGALMPTKFYKELWQTIKYDRRSFSAETKNRRKNQEEYYAFIRISPIIDKELNLLGFVATEEDITNQKQVVKDLDDARMAARNVMEDLGIEKSKVEKASAKEQAILHSIGEGLIAIDENGTIMLLNKSAEKLLGIKSEEVMRGVFSDFIPMENEKGDYIPREKRPINMTLVSGSTTTDSAYYYVRKDKTRFPVAVMVTPIILDGKVIGAIEAFRDITREREIDKAKTEFVSLASHQLRTPLTAIRWNAELLLSDKNLNDEQRNFVQEVYKGDLRMIDLVNTLLNVSRLELGTFMVEPKPTDMVALARSVVEEQKPEVIQKAINLVENYSENIKPYQADEKLARIIMLNLLSNAIKYTPAKGSIRLQLAMMFRGQTFGGKTLNCDCLVLLVADSGIGIPASQKAHIFTKLFRANNAQTVQTRGTGLGLYIVKEIVEQSGGAIWFESQENKGSSFYVVLRAEGMKQKEGTRSLD